MATPPRDGEPVVIGRSGVLNEGPRLRLGELLIGGRDECVVLRIATGRLRPFESRGKCMCG